MICFRDQRWIFRLILKEPNDLETGSVELNRYTQTVIGSLVNGNLSLIQNYAMIRYFTSIVILLALATGALAQPVFTLSDAQGNKGDVVSIDLKVKNFKAIVGFQFAVKFDPAKLKVKNVKNLTTALDEFDQQNIDFSKVNTDRGLITVAYANANSDDGFTIPDDGVFFTIEFEIIATGNTTAIVDIPQEVDFGEFSRKVEMIDNKYNEIGMTAKAGTITIGEGGGGPGRVGLSLGSASGSKGETVCIPVKVSSFSSIIGMQYSIKFDTDFLEYIEGRNFDLTNFSGASISTESVEKDKALIVSWTSPDSEPVSKADGSTIVELCFKIKKDNGESNVTFSESPQSIEFVVLEGGETTTVQANLTNGKISAGDGGTGGTDCDKPGFSVAASQITAPKGSNVCVNIVGKGIDRMAVLQTIIEWDPAVLSNPTLQTANLEVTGNDYNLEKGAQGKFLLSWTHNNPFGDGLTLDDNSLLFKLCFDVIGDNGAKTDITFTGDNETTQIATDIDGKFYTFQYCNGSVTVGQPEDVSVKKVNPTCNGNNDGSISLTVNKGQSPFKFAWTKNGQSVGATATIKTLTAGTYSYVVTDNTGAEIGKGDVVLEDPAPIKISSEITPIEKGNDGAIMITVTGGTGTYMYNWSTGADTKDLSNLPAGTYTLTVTDENGCSVSESITLGTGEFNVVISPTRDYNGADVSCNGESDASLQAKANFGAQPYSYQWNTGDETETIQNVGGGTYKVTVTDKDGKKAEASYTVKEPQPLVVRVNTTPSNGGNAGTAKAEVQGGTQPYTYEWNDKSPGSTTVFIGSLTEGSYRVIVKDANGCMTQGLGRVPIDDRDCFTAAQVMTPNADGLNDELRIACVEGTVNTLTVFDRYGAAVYQEENYNNLWTGIDSDGQALGDGVYYYVLQVKEIDGSTTQYKGHVTLLRRLN